TAQVTVEHLLAHTSGIPDYFERPGSDGRVLGDRLVELEDGVPGEDVAWDPHSALDMVRGVAPAFPPGRTKRAVYSDTNFQVLQLILEAADGAAYDTVAAR